MRIAVIGGTGLIGSRLVTRLTADDHDVVVASRATGVNSYTGEGLADALEGAEALIDVSNSDYLDERGANDFFYGFDAQPDPLRRRGRRAPPRGAVGRRHRPAGAHRARVLCGQGGAGAAHPAIRQALLDRARDPVLRVHPQTRGCLDQREHRSPLACAHPADGGRRRRRRGRHDRRRLAGERRRRVRGPRQFRLEEIVRRELHVRRDSREVVRDPLARYFGTDLDERELLPGAEATSRRRGSTTGSRAAGSPPAPPAACPELRRGDPCVSLSVRAWAVQRLSAA